MRLIVIVGLLFVSFVANAQRYATANGSWTGAIWATTPGGVPGSASTPTATDDVYTNGRLITVSGARTCRNLYVSYNVASSITLGSLASITITGTLSGYDDAGATEEFPTASVFVFALTSSLNFTASQIQPAYDPYIIYFWDNTIPLGRVNFNVGNGNTKNTILPLAFSGLLTIQTGELLIEPGAGISGNGTGSLVINNGALLTTQDPISAFSSVTITGTLSTSESVDVSGTFTMNSTGVFNTSYTNPSGGWWSSSSPTTINLNPASTVNFNRSGSQNISPISYGNLTLSGSGTITKSVIGAGTLNVGGTLTIASSSITLNSNSASAISIGGNISNAGTWAPTDLVTFNGTGAQSIGGTSTVSFNGGLDINKSAGTLSLNRAINISNGLTISQGTLNLGSQTVTLNSGNLDNDGTFTVGSSTFIINGTTTITGTSPVSFNNLTIGPSGNLSTSGTLNIAGNLANSGSLSATTVSFNGSSPQTITGTGTLGNVTITNTAGVSNNGTINLTGVLSLSGGGTFDADGSGSGNLIVISNDLSSNAGIAALTTPSDFTGNITVQRFVNGPDDWRYFSIPVSGGNVALWQDDFPVTGNFSNASPNGVNGVECSTCPSIYRFDAPTQAYVAIGTGGTTSATALSSNIGYTAYTYLTGDFTIDMAGSPTKGNVNVSLSAAGSGWNLVPNPYPSPIDWDNVNRTGTSGSMYMTTAQGSFATYLAGSGTCTGCSFNLGWRGEVAIGQSFWIESTGSTSLALTEAAKTTGSATFVREGEEDIDMIRIILKSSGKEDDIIIHFNEAATYSTELNLDAKKRLNDTYLNLSSYNTNPDQHYAINGIPLATCDAGTVKLKMSNLSGTRHSLTFTELEKLSLGYSITLIDNFRNTESIIDNNDVYNFETTADPASKADGRFELKFTSPAIQAVASASLSIESTCESNLLNIDISNSQRGVTYQLFKGTVPVSEANNGNGSVLKTFVLKSSLSSGINTFTLKANSIDGCQSASFDNITSYDLVALPQVVSAIGASVCNEGSATITAQGSSESVAYRWYNSQLKDSEYVQTIANKLTLESVKEPRTYYVSSLNKNGCESLTRIAVEISINKIVKPEITITGETLVSSSAANNQWYKDGVLISGATGSSLKVTETGIYAVKVSSGDCSAVSDNITMTITSIEDSVEGINIYPNPVVELLNVDLSADDLNRLVSIYVTDVTGRVYLSISKSELKSKNELNVSDLTSGLYILRLQGISKQQTFKVLKK